MKTSYKILILFAVTILMVRCAKIKVTPRDYPRLHTLSVTNISDTGAVFNADIFYRGDFTVLNYGFVWTDTQKVPTLETSDRVVYSNNIQTTRFSSDISTTLEEKKTYIVRAFIITKDYTVYGDTISFRSLGSQAPVIKALAPESGTWDDTISISGKNFSYLPETNIVRLGNISCKVLTATDSLLKVQIPETRNDSVVQLSVTILGNKGQAADNFHYLVPLITSVEPVHATFGDTITIRGVNFSKNPDYNEVLFSGILIPTVINTPTLLKVVVPDNLTASSYTLRVSSVGFFLDYPQPFTLEPPVIDSVGPLKITHPGDTITIKGNYFHPLASGNTVKIGRYHAKVTTASPKELQVTLPDSLIPVYNISVFQHNIPLTVTVAAETTAADSTLQIYWQSTWTRKADFPGPVRFGGVAFSINGKGYYGTGYQPNFTYMKDFWEYDPQTDHWTQIENLPGKARTGVVAFVLNNEGYVGLGSDQVIAPDNDSCYLKDFYKYDPGTGHWIKLSDFTGPGRVYSASFAVNGFGYMVTGNWGSFGTNPNYSATNESWQYDPSSDKWTQITNFPTLSSWAVGFNIGNTGYVYNNGILYGLVDEKWEQITSAPSKSLDGNIAFSISGKGYFGLGYGSTAFWEYDPNNQSFNNRTFISGYQWIYGPSAFVIGNKAYVVGGATPASSGYNYIHEVWEFDPTKPE